MLKMIQCDKFMVDGKVRPPIQFKPGLNTVLGDEVGSNSIGKSTMLMIIDFAFGGDDYLRRLIDVQENIGFHVINFTFEFEGTLHHFSRDTSDWNQVNVCDVHYNVKHTLSKDEYLKFLRQKFNLNLPELTFRSAVSRFFRIYGRETLDPKYPLQSAMREPQRDSIEGLLKLFNHYLEVKLQKERTNQAKQAESTFKNAQKYRYLPKVSNQVQYKENEKRILKLEQSIEKLVAESLNGTIDGESVQIESAAELRQQLKIAKRKYIDLVSELEHMEIDRIKRNSFEKGFRELQSFFPEVNMKKLEDIENFHRKLDRILKDEFKERCSELERSIALSSKEISQLEAKMTALGSLTNVTQIILSEHCQKQKELDQLKTANATYDTRKELKQKREALELQLNTLILEVMAFAEKEINETMKQLNQRINDEKTAPKLTIKDADRYTFTTSHDRGTGSQYKGLIVFDLTALKMTDLPVLVHDSVLLKQIEDHTLEAVLKLYTETEKQVFISLDKKSSFSKGAQLLLQQTNVLQLHPKGGELFGYAWNVTQTDL